MLFLIIFFIAIVTSIIAMIRDEDSIITMLCGVTAIVIIIVMIPVTVVSISDYGTGNRQLYKEYNDAMFCLSMPCEDKRMCMEVVERYNIHLRQMRDKEVFAIWLRPFWKMADSTHTPIHIPR